MSRHSDFYSEARIHSKAIWDALSDLEAMQHEHQSLDYGTTLPDGEGENVGLTEADVTAVVFSTANALRALLDTGHATNLAKLL